MEFDVIVIGAGLSGLSAAALMAKRGLTTAVVEHSAAPGGSCGVFKRDGTVFDQGAAMLYGFGRQGFNAHRFLFNCLEEPFEVIRHSLLYTVRYKGRVIRFYPDLARFVEELGNAFPGQKTQIARFYQDMERLYRHVLCQRPSYTTPDETNPREALGSVVRHPLSYVRFLSYLNQSAESLLRRYFTDPEILGFFDKLTSTYCYATVAEAPAIMASVMFVDNHRGGSWYPCGSTLFLPGKLEKVIEENGGTMFYRRRAEKLLFRDGQPRGALLDDGTRLWAKQILYSGTVWSLYNHLLEGQTLTEAEIRLKSQIPTYPSVVLYTLVNREVIPSDACPIEMLASKPGEPDEEEVTLYMLSLDDRTLCPLDACTVTVIGPSFRPWSDQDQAYQSQKAEEAERLTDILERRFPGFRQGLRYRELATPRTLARYALKDGGAVAGPKQMLGQHMLLRQPIRTRWETLFCCGESTTMGTGTPTVTTSGIAAANAALKARGEKPFVWREGMKDYVREYPAPVTAGWLQKSYPPQDAEMMELAGQCQYCETPACCPVEKLDIPGILRRASCGNFTGALGELDRGCVSPSPAFLKECQQRCIRKGRVPIERVMGELLKKRK